MAIRTNKLQAVFSYERLGEKYDYYRVTSSKAYIPIGASILDAPLLDNRVQSVLFECGKSFYVMLLKVPGNRQVLKDVFSTDESSKDISFQNVKPEEIEESILVQLLINALGNAGHPLLRYNNLTGHFYCFHPNWVVHGRQADAETIWKIPCLELKISKNLLLSLKVRTFTSTRLKKKIKFTKRRFEDYPKYVFGENNTLKRKLKTDSGDSFILRQKDGDKTEIPFIDLYKFEQSKMGILNSVISEFNNRYDGICSLSFQSIDESTDLLHQRKADRTNNLAVRNYLQKRPVRIVDKIGDVYSNEFCGQILTLLLEKYDVKAVPGKRIKKDALNIVVIHNAAYYCGSVDPYDEDQSDCVVQHITFEDYSADSAFALNTIIHELLIKDDIKKGKLSLFDWEKGNFGNMSFGLAVNEDNQEYYYFMDIEEDGTFKISEQQYDMFGMDDYSKCMAIFEDAKTTGENIVGIIRDTNGNYNMIKDTGWFAIPEIEEIQTEISTGNTKLRNREKREKLLSACLDIHMFNIPNEPGVFYFVGDIGEGMRWNMPHAACIRKVEPYESAPDLFSGLLPLMDVTFVRNGQLTVMPFPFKYLREYISIRHLK